MQCENSQNKILLDRQIFPSDFDLFVVQKEDELGCIQSELVDTRRSHEEQISELQNDHLEQLTCLEQRLNNQHVDELDRGMHTGWNCHKNKP